MKNYPQNQFAQIPNEYISFHRTRIASELEEKFIALAVVDMQSKFQGLKATNQPCEWEHLAVGKITFSEFSKIMNVTNNTQELRKSLQDLKSLGLRVSYRALENGKLCSFDDYISVFDRFKVNNDTGVISWSFCKYFQEFFTDIGKHFQLSIAEIVALNSTHSIRIYSLLKSKYNMDKAKHQFTLEEIKKFLNIDKKYNLYTDLKRHVLEIAKRQINASSSAKFQLDYTELKEGKKVVGIEFEIIPLGEKYYDVTKKLPNYKKNQDYNKYKKLTSHENTTIAELARNLVAFIEAHGFDPEQRLFKMYNTTLNIELEDYNTRKNQQSLDF